jgi:cyclohexyl-isocyanide hydratase
MTNAAPLHIGFLLYPQLTQLDLTGPYEVLARVPGARLHLAWKDRAPEVSDSGLAIVPTVTLADAPAFDVLVVPGGFGQIALMDDALVHGFLQRQAAGARFVTSVCTGSLLLGAAGLLRGYRAATHWMYMDLLPAYGATPVAERVVVDRDRITGGGVTAGIDFGLRVLAELAGDDAARATELGLEYDPHPPFGCGHPRVAPPAVVDDVRRQFAARISARRQQAGT